MRQHHWLFCVLTALPACVWSPVVSGHEHQELQTPMSFHDDVTFLQTHTKLVVLQREAAAVAVAPAYQGRVMTSTYDQETGPSFGWINRPVIAQGVLDEAQRRGRLEEHIHIFGGEERFWLGPEGGQFAIFFEPGAAFDFNSWKTPAVIDTDAFAITHQSDEAVAFEHSCRLLNHSGTRFDVRIGRQVRLLGMTDVTGLLPAGVPPTVQMVGYETDNTITNVGQQAWTPETGLLSIWMLGMYNPSPRTTVVIPFRAGDEGSLGPAVNDTYFGKVPPEHLRLEDGVLFFRGDGTRRGKIGVSPLRSRGIAGSYDADGEVLTVVTYNVQDAPHGFVNSMWEHQDHPYQGDVLNAYNDGPPEPGADPLGPFYELETSSPAAALAPQETMRHVQQTWHFQGSEAALDPLAKALLGVSLEAIAAAF